MQPFRIRPISEQDLDAVIVRAKGRRAHLDADRRSEIGADYRLGGAVIELKALDEDGLDKPERRAKLAQLFREYWPDRPVIVLDPARLPLEGLRRYRTIMRGPLKSGITQANKQLQQSRLEHPDASCSVLFLVNNSYAALTHDELMALAQERVINDTTHIDALVVAGCYLHGDGFEAMSIWPMDRVEIFPERPFTGYEALKSAWSGLADKLMTEMIISGEGTKTPVKDTVFEIDGVTFVKPAPPLGRLSEFYVHGRPRNEPAELEAVATTFPGLSPAEFSRLQKTPLGRDPAFADYEGWKALQARASSARRPEQPFVVMPVTRGSYEAWRKKTGAAVSFKTLLAHANDRFDFAVRRLIAGAREQADEAGLPRRCVMALTEVIGQDAANDVSEVVLVTRTGRGGPQATPLVRNARMSHRQALALAAAHAVASGLDAIVWWRDERYAWL